ncbi:MAG: hypothetical protein JWQ96_1220 [Segetibacter sp.]|nr:hypothetical protein [Segetibacter sp.]
MKKLLIVLFVLGAAYNSFANANMQGIYHSGFASQLYPLLKEDSVHFGKIKIQNQRVLINLYRGFAALKVEFWMYNATNETITMPVGYPLHGNYPQPQLEHIFFRDLFKLRVFVNDRRVAFANLNDTATHELEKDIEEPIKDIKVREWYFWQTTFPAHSVTKITTYFLTNTNDAHLRKGYSGQTQNGFSYLLEKGRGWGQHIDSGSIYIQLNNGLTVKDFLGVIPANKLVGDDTHVQFTFNSFNPSPADNIIIWYKAKKDVEFNFWEVQTKARKYFYELDNFPIDAFNKSSFVQINKNDFTLPDKTKSMFWAATISSSLLGVAILAAIIFLGVILFERAKARKTI